MKCITKECVVSHGCLKKTHVPLGCMLWKKITKKHFVQLKTTEMMGRKTILLIRLFSGYYQFGCRKYICKKCCMRNKFRFAMGICNTCKGFVCINLYYLLEGHVIEYGLDAFYNCKDCLLNKNISLKKHILKGAESIFQDIKQSLVHLHYLSYKHYKHYIHHYKHYLKRMVSYVKFCITTEFEGVDCLQTQILKANVTNAKNLCQQITVTMQKYMWYKQTKRR